MATKQRNKQVTGKIGEALAVGYLRSKGYQLLERNWRFGRVEIDLIFRKGDRLHFIEVKTRRSLRYGWPEEHIKRRKITRMMVAVEAYLRTLAKPSLFQLDILSIVLSDRKPPAFWLIEDVYI
ncbi:MAG TPA: YraN family protein [Puia sp.]|nr:YraN family protein [Puia sp.]